MQRRLIVLRMAGALALIVVLFFMAHDPIAHHDAAPTQPAPQARYSPALLGALNTAAAADDGAYGLRETGTSDITATNAAGRFTATFTPSGVRIAPDSGSTWMLHLVDPGNGIAVTPTPPVVNGARVEYRRGSLTEWYINGPVGLEQGFTLTTPPTGDARVTLTVALNGQSTATLSQGSVRLGGSGDGLQYGTLAAWDATGHILPTHLTLTNDGTSAQLAVETAGAVFPVAVDPLIGHGGAITASDGAANDSFGYSVAVSDDGNTVVVGAPNYANRTGKVYVFTRNASSYTLAAPTGLKTTGDTPNDRFGIAVATNSDGSVIAVGANGTSGDTGTVYVFGTATSMTQTLAAAGTAAPGNRFGESVALSADGLALLAGAPGTTTAGHAGGGTATGFTRATTTAIFGTGVMITASDVADGDNFGNSVALNSDGTHGVVGAYGKNQGASNATGAAYVIARSGGTWSAQTPTLAASNGQANDQFGVSVAINADASMIAVGAFGANAFTGSAYTFIGSSGHYTAGQTLVAPSGHPDDRFGISVAIGGPGIIATVLVGADGVNNFMGAAYLFRQQPGGGMFQPVNTITASDGVGSDRFGAALALGGMGSNAHPVIGAVERNGGAYTGAAYGFDFTAVTVTGITTTAPTGTNSGNSGTASAPMLRSGTTIPLTTVGVYSDGSTGNVSGLAYSGYDPAKLTVDANGVVTARAAGSTTITITAPTGAGGTVSTTISVIVLSATPPDVQPTAKMGGTVTAATPAPQPTRKADGNSPTPGGPPTAMPSPQPVRR